MVYVQSKTGQPIMPTKDHRKVRLLLNSGKAKVVKRVPFTIRLLGTIKTYTQEVTLGVDAGSKHVGLSASTETEELFRGELQPRNDVVALLSTRRELRKSRRNRKKRYRKARFDNRVHSKHKGWLAPSVEVKINNHIQGIKSIMRLLPIAKVVIETAEFDTQRLKAMLEGRPIPVGTDYQRGEQYDHYNVRQYVFHRDGYKCRCCGKASTETHPLKFEVHHLETRKKGGNSPGNLVTLCNECHDLYHRGLKDLKFKRTPSMRDAAFMGIMRWEFYNRLKTMLQVQVRYTYGYITKFTREENGIKKTHTSDALCIAGHPKAQFADTEYLLKPVRSHNRQIHKQKVSKGGYRKLNQSPKYVFGFRLFDMVQLPDGKSGFILGRRSSGYFDIRHLDGVKITASANYKRLNLIQKQASMLYERRIAR